MTFNMLHTCKSIQVAGYKTYMLQDIYAVSLYATRHIIACYSCGQITLDPSNFGSRQVVLELKSMETNYQVGFLAVAAEYLLFPVIFKLVQVVSCCFQNRKVQIYLSAAVHPFITIQRYKDRRHREPRGATQSHCISQQPLTMPVIQSTHSQVFVYSIYAGFPNAGFPVLWA